MRGRVSGITWFLFLLLNCLLIAFIMFHPGFACGCYLVFLGRN